MENGCKIKKNIRNYLQIHKIIVSLPPEIVSGRIFATTFHDLGLFGFDSGSRWYVSTRRLLWFPP